MVNESDRDIAYIGHIDLYKAHQHHHMHLFPTLPKYQPSDPLQNLRKPCLHALSPSTNSQPLHNTSSPHFFTPLNLIDKPPSLPLTIQRPRLTLTSSPSRPADSVHVASQAARNVVLQDVRDAAGGESVEATGGAVRGDHYDWSGRGGWFGEEGFDGRFGQGGGEWCVGGFEVLDEVGEAGSGFGG